MRASAPRSSSSAKPPEWHPHVADCIMHAARLLESLLGNADFARGFAEAGGVPLLLRLYTLRHLPATFGSSAASHALLAALRAATQSHAGLVTEKVAEALADHLRTTLLLAMVHSLLAPFLCMPRCFPCASCQYLHMQAAPAEISYMLSRNIEEIHSWKREQAIGCSVPAACSCMLFMCWHVCQASTGHVCMFTLHAHVLTAAAEHNPNI
jgi:hypothetical protein